MTQLHRHIIFISIFLLFPFCLFSETEVSGYITSDETWSRSNSPYVVVNDVYIRQGGRLTIEAGTKIRFNSRRSIVIEGLLRANGSPGDSIIFTANSDQASKPFWGNIKFIDPDHSSSMSYCRIEYGGSNGAAAIQITGKNFSLPDIYALSARNNRYNGIELPGGDYNFDITIPSTGIPFILKESIVVAKGRDLVLQPGAILKLSSDCNITMNGTLISEGTLANEIIITSLSDDEYGGDADGNKSSSGSQNPWGGLFLSRYSNDEESKIKFTTFRFGGRSSFTQNSMIYFESCSPMMEYSTIEYAAYQGLFCHKGSSPDLGGGDKSSQGHNTFTGFSSPNFIIVNNSTTDIYAQKCCWGSDDTEYISSLIYDKENRSSFGNVFFEDMLINCRPTIPEPPVLILPKNKSGGYEDTISFSWSKPQFTDYYQIYVSRDSLFSEFLFFEDNLIDTTIELGSFDFQTKYYWKVRAVNALGYGDFSDVHSFRTMDTTKPEKVELISPSNGDDDVYCSLSFLWHELENADNFRIVIAIDSLFSIIYLSDDQIYDNFYKIAGLNEFITYYWRVSARNRFGWGEWSDTFSFSTQECPARMPPGNWTFENRTGSNSTILFRKNVDFSDLDYPLQKDDAIGVFYFRDREVVCGGYAFWEGDKNIVVPVWGDNPQTHNIKDGFDYREYYRFKIWRSQISEEKPVLIKYEKGSNYFYPDKLAIVDSIKELERFEIDVKQNNWDLISSPVVPFYPFLDSLFDENILMRNERNIIFLPNDNIEDEYLWNTQNGYKINSYGNDIVEFIGSPVNIEDISIDLKKNEWKYMSVPSFRPISISSFLTEVNNIYLIKDIEGNVIIPEYNYYDIDTLFPGKAYQVIAQENSDIKYEFLNKDATELLIGETEHFSLDYENTGNDMTLIVESSEIGEKDELAVLTEDNKIAGVAKEHDGRFISTVWGDDSFTIDVIDGCYDGEELGLLLWKKNQNKEYRFYVKELKNPITDEVINHRLKYSNDKIYLALCSTNPSYIEQNDTDNLIKLMPNPVDDILNISLHNSTFSKIEISIVSAYGERDFIVDEYCKNGVCTWNIPISGFANGIYLIEIRTTQGIFTEKFIILQ